jgi:hypothetical protein
MAKVADCSTGGVSAQLSSEKMPELPNTFLLLSADAPTLVPSIRAALPATSTRAAGSLSGMSIALTSQRSEGLECVGGKTDASNSVYGAVEESNKR